MATVRYTVIDGEVVAEKRNGVRRFYVPDPLGSTVALLDNTQAKTDTFSYWPYGEEASRTGTTPTPFRFVGTRGYYWDGEPRCYARHRVYAATRGTWTTPGWRGEPSDGLSDYLYADDAPLVWIAASGSAVLSPPRSPAPPKGIPRLPGPESPAPGPEVPAPAPAEPSPWTGWLC